MSNRFGSFIKKKLLGKNNNLVSFDDPYEIMRRLLKGCQVSAILDVGASDGHISERLLRKFPDACVYAFEPNPLYRDILQRYAEKDSRFHPCFSAVSDIEGAAELYITQSPGNSSLLTPAKQISKFNSPGASVKNLIKVDVVTIDQWARRNGNIPIQLMKLDIQAAELKALQGAVNVLRTSMLLVYTEIWFNPAYEEGAFFSQVDSFLRQNSFQLFDLFKPGYDASGRIMWANAVYIHSNRLFPKAAG